MRDIPQDVFFMQYAIDKFLSSGNVNDILVRAYLYADYYAFFNQKCKLLKDKNLLKWVETNLVNSKSDRVGYLDELTVNGKKIYILS